MDVEETVKEPREQTVATTPGGAMRVFGWKEWIYLEGHTKRIKAKLDTGAKTSSIHAENIKMIEKDGVKWVRFTVVVSSGKDSEKKMDCEAPYSRQARVRTAGGVLSERVVVHLKFRIGELERVAEFTLNNRGDMIHPILLGRSAIKTLGLMDANSIYLAKEKIMR